MKIVAANKESSEIIGAGWHIDKWTIARLAFLHDFARPVRMLYALVSGLQLWEGHQVLRTIAAACSPR
jgi:hypothetical protein